MSINPSDFPKYPDYAYAPPRQAVVELKFRSSCGTFVNKRGNELFYKKIYTEGDDEDDENQSQLKPVIIFYHGIQEHMARYDHVMERFATLGFRVAAMDMVGHGLSEGRRAYIDRFKDYIDDAEEFLDKVVTQTMNPSKYFLWGQSYGGLIAPHCFLRFKSRPDFRLAGLMLTSCAVGVDKTFLMKMQMPFGPCTSALLPKLKLTPAVAPEMMSSDPKAVENYAKDPLNTSANLYARLAWETELAMRTLSARMGEITLPLYMTHGTLDVCTSRKLAKVFYESVSSKDKTFDEMELFHTMLHEPRREEVIQNMCKWLDAHRKDEFDG